jgi:hypothetical protein
MYTAVFSTKVFHEEQKQLDAKRVSLTSYIIQQSKYYNGIVYHWGHSDDTYNLLTTETASILISTRLKVCIII